MKEGDLIKYQLRLDLVFNAGLAVIAVFGLSVLVSLYAGAITWDWLTQPHSYVYNGRSEKLVNIAEMAWHSCWISIFTSACLVVFLLPIGVGLGVYWQWTYALVRLIDEGQIETVKGQWSPVDI